MLTLALAVNHSAVDCSMGPFAALPTPKPESESGEDAFGVQPAAACDGWGALDAAEAKPMRWLFEPEEHPAAQRALRRRRRSHAQNWPLAESFAGHGAASPATEPIAGSPAPAWRRPGPRPGRCSTQSRGGWRAKQTGGQPRHATDRSARNAAVSSPNAGAAAADDRWPRCRSVR